MASSLPRDWLTPFLAVWGAILASITFGWNLYRDLQDRARLKVEARLRRIMQSADGRWYAVNPDLPVEGASKQVFVVMDVTNLGRRPIRWVGWGGKYREPVKGRNSFVIIPANLPKMLNEGEFHSEMTHECLDSIENIKQLFAWDSAGKYWYVSEGELKRIVADVRKFATKAVE